MKIAFALATLISTAILAAGPAAAQGATPITPCGPRNVGQSVQTQHPAGDRNWICRENPPSVFYWDEVH